MYDLGETVDEFEHRQQQVTVRGGWSRGLEDGRTRRWLAGFTYDQNEFGPSGDVPNPRLIPEDRKLVYPWIGYSLVTDDFRAVEELNEIGRTEDVNLGLSLEARLGYSSTRFGADRDAWIFNTLGQKGWEPAPGKLVFVDFGASTRLEDGGAANSIVSAGARYYRRNFGNKLFFVSLSGTATHDLDLDQQVLVGGDSGLRGYPLRYQSGTARAVLTFEERVFTDWYPWKLVRVGYAAFFDSGRTWGRDPRGTESLGTLHDIGFGLRLSSPRSSSGTVVHIDLAFPLDRTGSIDSAQLNIETRGSF
jgi:hemolysin activation/secretion protein